MAYSPYSNTYTGTNVGTDLNNQTAYLPGSNKDKFLKNLYEMKSTYGDTPAYQQNLQKDWDNFQKTGEPLSLPKKEYSGVEGFASLNDPYAGIAGQTAMLPDNMLQTMTDAYGGDQPLQFSNPQQYYMENIPAFGYDRGWEGPIGSTGLHNRRPSVQYQEQSFHPETWEGRNLSTEEQQDPFWSTEREYNPMLQKALISQNRENLYGQTNMQQDYRRPPLNQTNMAGLPAVQDFSFSKYQGPSQEEEGITAAQTQGKKVPPGLIGLIANMFQGAGKKLGMTQVTDADRAANEQFMGQQGIGINPQTGRMYGGDWNEASKDFAGMNAPGASGWGSANFGEMAQKWDEKYGEMQYKTQKMKDKQARIKNQALAYAQQLNANKIAAATGQGGAQIIDGPKTGDGGYTPPAAPGTTGSWTPGGTYTAPSNVSGGYQQKQGSHHPGAGGWHPGVKSGGYIRRGYSRGGRVGILSVF